MRARVIMLAICGAAVTANAYAGVLVVTSNANAGPGTLRSAIAEATSGDRIAFALPAGATVVTLAEPLPVSPSPLAIDADNQAGTVTLTGGALPFGAGVAITIGPGGVLVLDMGLTGDNPEAGLTVSGGGTLVLERAGQYRGATIIDGGTIRLGAHGQLPASSLLKLEGGTFDLDSHDQRVSGLSGERGLIALGSGTLTVDEDANTIFGGTIEGPGALAKTGAGRLALTQPQVWTGGTRVGGGTLELSGSGPTMRLSGSIEITGGALIAPGIRLGVPSR
jgi:autotransporter-associated beta strand protein